MDQSVPLQVEPAGRTDVGRRVNPPRDPPRPRPFWMIYESDTGLRLLGETCGSEYALMAGRRMPRVISPASDARLCAEAVEREGAHPLRAERVRELWVRRPFPARVAAWTDGGRS